MRNKILSIYAVAILLGILTGLMGSVFQLAIRGLNALLTHGFHYAGSLGARNK